MFKIKLKSRYLTISKEIIVVLIMDIFALAYFVSIRELSSASKMFPKFLLLGILIISIICFLQGIHFHKEITEEIRGQITTAPGFGFSKKLLLFMLMVLMTLLLFSTLGALLCCWLFLIGSMILLEVRSKWVLILVPLIEVLFIYFVFKVWLGVPLPSGIFL